MKLVKITKYDVFGGSIKEYRLSDKPIVIDLQSVESVEHTTVGNIECVMYTLKSGRVVISDTWVEDIDNVCVHKAFRLRQVDRDAIARCIEAHIISEM